MLDGINFSAADGEIVCVVGPSGCGKTTLLNLISGLLEPCGGEVRRETRKTGYVFQEDRLLEWCTVYENIAIVAQQPKRDEILGWIDKVGLKGFENALPRQLSGGMRQRCSLARAFYYEAPLLLMDEPFKSLDYRLRLEMTETLTRLWQKKRNTIIFVTHEIDEALMLGDRILVLSNRPSRALDVIALNRPREARRPTDADLNEVRNRIINYLLKE